MKRSLPKLDASRLSTIKKGDRVNIAIGRFRASGFIVD